MRALHELAHGHLAEALRCNALLVLSLPVLAFLGARRFLRWRAGRPLPRLVLRPAWVIFIVAMLVLFGVLRNLPFPPFMYFSPP